MMRKGWRLDPWWVVYVRARKEERVRRLGVFSTRQVRIREEEPLVNVSEVLLDVVLSALWAKVANETLRRSGDEGRAVRTANYVVKRKKPGSG